MKISFSRQMDTKTYGIYSKFWNIARHVLLRKFLNFLMQYINKNFEISWNFIFWLKVAKEMNSALQIFWRVACKVIFSKLGIIFQYFCGDFFQVFSRFVSFFRPFCKIPWFSDVKFFYYSSDSPYSSISFLCDTSTYFLNMTMFKNLSNPV